MLYLRDDALNVEPKKYKFGELKKYMHHEEKLESRKNFMSMYLENIKNRFDQLKF